MNIIDTKVFHIIGMSPGNSYFKDDEVLYLLKTTIEKFGRVAVLIADIPAISTYIALGYPENRARRDKAIPKGNALKNRILKAMSTLGYTNEMVKIIDWEKEVENNHTYNKCYKRVVNFYENNIDFRNSANTTTQAVLKSSDKNIADIEKATKIAVHYLLSEIAFLEFAPSYLGVEKVIYIYHKNWLVYEDYISGKFDKIKRPNLDFILLENPYEMYRSTKDYNLLEKESDIKYRDALEKIEDTKILRVGFAKYAPAFIYDNYQQNYSGIFHDIINSIANKYGWRIEWVEEVGYGAIVDGLKQNRFDVFGSTVWPIPERENQVIFSESLYNSPTFLWIRDGYKKTENEIKNDSNIRVAVKENDISDSIAKADFIDNRLIKVPQLSDASEVLKKVAEDRADFTFAEKYLVEQFNKSSEVKLIPISENPIRIFDNTFVFKLGEQRLRDLFNSEIEQLKKQGVVNELIVKYVGDCNYFVT